MSIRRKSRRRSKPLATKMAQATIDRASNVRAVPLCWERQTDGAKRYVLRNGRLVGLPEPSTKG